MIDSYSMSIGGDELTLEELARFGRTALRFGFTFDSTVEFDGETLTVDGCRND